MMMREIGNCWTAVAAFGANLGLFVARRPRTPLRVLSVIAVDSVMRSRGEKLRPDRRRAVIEALELGALLNDYFDGDAFSRDALRASASWFADSPHRRPVWDYARRLRRLERSRPEIGESVGSIRRYREAVNQVSLAALWSLANAKALPLAEREIEREPDLRLLHQIVMLTQVIDDVLDVRRDRRRGLPSFATASEATPASLRQIASSYANSSAIPIRGNFSLRVGRRIVWLVARATIALGFGVTRQAESRATKARQAPVLEQG